MESDAAEETLLQCSKSLSGFLASMFKSAHPTGFVSLCAFQDNRDGNKALFVEPISIRDPQLLEVIVERANQAATWDTPAVFCPPIVTFRTARNARTDSILEGVALSVDCDQSPKAAIETLQALLGDPTMMVASGGGCENPDTGEIERKVHAHWRLRAPTRTAQDHDRLNEARGLATTLIGGDHSGIALVHPFHWPGSWHRKKNPPRLAEIVLESDNEIDLSETLNVLREAVGASILEPSHQAQDHLQETDVGERKAYRRRRSA
jgi:hypothetical protein